MGSPRGRLFGLAHHLLHHRGKLDGVVKLETVSSPTHPKPLARQTSGIANKEDGLPSPSSHSEGSAPSGRAKRPMGSCLRASAVAGAVGGRLNKLTRHRIGCPK